MAVSKAKRLELDQRRVRVADLYLKGMVQAEIADEIGVDQSTVSRDLTEIQKEWKASSIRNLDEAKAQELAKIDKLERTYWEAWERSIGTAQVKTIKAKGDTKGQPAQAEQTIRTEDLNGDPRFLTGVMTCIERRCKLLGIDAPEKMNSTNLNIDISELTDEQLERIANGEPVARVIADSRKG